jgi:hypothetical protein
MVGDEGFRARARTSKSSKLGYECNMSVRLHYLEVFDDSSVMDLIILMIGLKASVISNKDLIGRSGWPGTQTRDILQRGQLRLSDKIPLDNSTTSDETQATYMLIISLRSRRQ